jgi:hypothetical protein
MTRPRHAHRRPLRLAAVLALLVPAGACTPVERVVAADDPGPGGAAGQATGGPGTADVDPVRIKGLRPHLRLHRQRGTAIEALRDGDVARAGDLVQMSYMAAGHHHGVILSLDGRGQVTLHHPARADAPTTLESRGEHALDHAYELDDAQGYERFVLVTAGDEPLSPTVVLAAARDLARRGRAARHSPLPLPARWQQSSILLQKRP